MKRTELPILIQQHGTKLATVDKTTLSYYFGTHPAPTIQYYFDGWLFPALSHHPKLQSPSITLTWITALQGESIVGVALLHAPSKAAVEIVSFKVHPMLRQQGIGTALFRQVESLCTSYGFQQVAVTFRTYWRSNTYWEALLQKSNWHLEPPKLYYAITDDTSEVFQQLSKKTTPSEESTYLPITSDSWRQLEDTVEQPEWQNSIPDGLHPLQLKEKKIDLHSSFLIIEQSNKTIIGWAILHLLKPGITQLTTLFLATAHRGSGIAVIMEIARRHQNRGRLHFIIQADNTKMLAFAKRYLCRWGCKLYEQKRAVHKPLSQPTVTTSL